ncbi:gamma-glutamylcyclotransferase [Paucibacter sp. AS339]|uniref:gamma-glutamylcyclotransferase n=1 Tax=Paucibacter hankyongi TaxID=3133434 RepID=UPI00309B394F
MDQHSNSRNASGEMKDEVPNRAQAESTPESSADNIADALARLPQRSRDLLQVAQQAWDRQHGLLLFAYGSLIWKPGFVPAQTWPARVHGYHRALRLRSLVNRGSAEQPGLVLTLLSGGSCQGLVYRVQPSESEALLNILWAREMVVGSYQPRWLNCLTPDGPRRALGFTLSRASAGHVGALSEAALLHIFRHASGRYGTTLDYLIRTVKSLHERGLHDADLERQWRLAARHGLCPPLE